MIQVSVNQDRLKLTYQSIRLDLLQLRGILQ